MKKESAFYLILFLSSGLLLLYFSQINIEDGKWLNSEDGNLTNVLDTTRTVTTTATTDPLRNITAGTGEGRNDSRTSSTQIDKLNVLFLVSDDLRPQLNSYEGVHNPNPYNNFRMHTPNLDDLARRSLQLNRAYVQFALCNPSRASYMTSRRPDTTKVWDLETYWRDAGGNFTTIPQYFKQHGYTTAGMGKIYHPGHAGGLNDPPSWTERYFHESNTLFYQDTNNSWWAVPEVLAQEKPLHDEEITKAAIRFMTEHAETGKQPFFLAVGFQKPHIPFVFPDRYLKYYPLEDMDLAGNPYAPKNFPQLGWFPIEGSGQYEDIKACGVTRGYNETLPDETAKLMRRAYFACVTFVDDMVGRLLETVAKLGLSKNTIISFIGDHGFHLGENGMWGKHTNLEKSTHAPMMIRVPGRTDRGLTSDSLVEFLDLFPTLVEAAGIDALPSCPKDSSDVLTCTEGKSFLKLVDQPELEIRSRAVSQMGRYRAAGYTLRTDRYRYVEWTKINKTELSEDRCEYDFLWNKRGVEYQELYDFERDPEENENILEHPDYKELVSYFEKELREVVPSSFIANCNQA